MKGGGLGKGVAKGRRSFNGEFGEVSELLESIRRQG